MAKKCTAWKKKKFQGLHWWEKKCSSGTPKGTVLYCSVEPSYKGSTDLFWVKMLKKKGVKGEFKVGNLAKDIPTLAQAKAKCDLWMRGAK